MPKKAKILIVDDDQALLDLLTMHLRGEGYQILTATDGGQALTLIEKDNPDLLLLDLMMPRVDGFTVCEQVREYSEVPIIIVSAIGHEEQKVKALNLGADDYLTKPYGKSELQARVHAALRRANQSRQGARSSVFTHGGFKIDFLHHQASVNGELVGLTRIEYGLLRELAKRPGEVVPHEVLLRQVWGPAYIDSVQYLHVHIGKLRRKLSGTNDVKIITQSGVGYLLAAS
jgi:DNA-binding response OmpR family regulator